MKRILIFFIFVCLSLQSIKTKKGKSGNPELQFKDTCSKSCTANSDQCESSFPHNINVVQSFFPANYQKNFLDLVAKYPESDKANKDKLNYLKHLYVYTEQTFKRFNEYKFEIADLAILFCTNCCSAKANCGEKFVAEGGIEEESNCFGDLFDFEIIKSKVQRYIVQLKELNDQWNKLFSFEASKTFEKPSIKEEIVEIISDHDYNKKSLLRSFVDLLLKKLGKALGGSSELKTESYHYLN